MQIVCLLGSPHAEGISAAIARRFLNTAGRLDADAFTFELNRFSCRCL